jgi:hypothetical protein
VKLRDGISSGTEDTGITFLFPSIEPVIAPHSLLSQLAELGSQEEGLIVGGKSTAMQCACRSDLLLHHVSEDNQF